MIFKEFVKEIRDLNSSTLLNKTVVCIAKDTLLIIGNKYKVHNEIIVCNIR